MIKTILFDLDGTLLPMNQDVFTKEYFKQISAEFEPHGYAPDKLTKGIWSGIKAMTANDGSCTNEEAFWKCFSDIFGSRALTDKPLFDEYYRTKFQKLSEFCGFNPSAKETVERLKKNGFRIVLATNPVFPAAATEGRIRWSGCRSDDFELYTVYENIGYCKPNPEYYREILRRIGCRPDECIMVGNDVEEDMSAETVGIGVFLLTDCLINRKNKDIAVFPHGGFDELNRYIEAKTANRKCC